LGYSAAVLPLVSLAFDDHKLRPRIVLIAGDEEYRSEEMLPQLARILTDHHGFDCRVIYPIGKDGTIDPGATDHIAGLEILDTTDLVICMLRFRCWPDAQMAHFVRYVESGRPIIGIRTSTHAFNYPADNPSPYRRYSFNSKEWEGGFGRQILGETWVAHHGDHLVESTRAVPAKGQERNELLNGVTDLWVPSDVYTAAPLDSKVLMDGQVLAGMTPTDPPLTGPKNQPMMPVAWMRTGFKSGRVFTTTMGSGLDFLNEGLRRLLVNATYWGLGQKIPAKANVELVGRYEPSPIGFGMHKTGILPPDQAS